MGSRFPGGAIGRRSFLVSSVKAIELVGLVALMSCTPRSNSSDPSGTQASQPETGKTMTLSSTAFSTDGTIPPKFTCDGENLSPALSWDAPPAGTKSLAILVSDPDASGKPFVHWVLYDLPPDLRQLPEGVPANPLLSQGGTQGKSDFGKFGYGGPCPLKAASDDAHRYVFKLYALDKLLDLAPGASQQEVMKAMEGHTLAEAELIGRYRRL